MPGEFDLIDWIQSQHNPTDFVRIPQGDDLAVLKWNAADLLLVGVDQALDGVHFDSALHAPRLIGRKVMNRNLSDCAAMACLPAAAVATVALTKGTGIEYAKELYLGLRDAADPFGCVLVGGDTASWPGKLAVTVTILGKSAGITPITRAGAKPGDTLFVSGHLGGSILGRHLSFTPRIELAQALLKALGENLHAMMDLSDGLAQDLPRLCKASNVGAQIHTANLPIHPDAWTLSENDHLPAGLHALADGEDYELLFAIHPDAIPNIVNLTETPLTAIGTITAEKSLHLIDESGASHPWPKLGFEHKS